MEGTLVLHVLLIIIFVLLILICRMYCRNHYRHKMLQFLLPRMHPLRVTPVLQTPSGINRCRCNIATQIESINPSFGDNLPGSNTPHSVELSVQTDRMLMEDNQEDQISLESHVISNESPIYTANDVKSPPPPYSTEDLPTYEEAIRWSQIKNTESVHHF